MDDSLHAHLEALVQPEVAANGFTLFELELLRGGGRLTIRLSIDPDPSTETGVSVEDCATVSRAVSRILEAEAEDRLRGKYVMEVTTPGLFRTLRTPSHFERFVGQLVKLVVQKDDDGDTRQLRGTLLAVDAAGVEIEAPGGNERLAYGDIRKANLDPDLDFGKARKKRRA